jgi:Fe-S-cluster containining protein
VIAGETREQICLACSQKTCCSYYVVSVTARDIWRIMRAMEIAPGDFLRYYACDHEVPGCFLLGAEGSFCDLVLAKQPLPEPLASPCVFLVRTTDGHGLCGLGELRPGQCQSYPVFQQGDLLRLVNDAEACVRTWSHVDIEASRERPLLGRLASEEEEHRGLVAEWNRRVRVEPRERTFDEFCAFLVNCCAGGEGS